MLGEPSSPFVRGKSSMSTYIDSVFPQKVRGTLGEHRSPKLGEHRSPSLGEPSSPKQKLADDDISSKLNMPSSSSLYEKKCGHGRGHKQKRRHFP